jgi:hypothetical protein
MVEIAMKPTADFLSTHIGTIPFSSIVRSEIRVRRDMLESALRVFYEKVGEVRTREEQVFRTLADLLPQTFAAMLEENLPLQRRSLVLTLLQTISDSGRSGHPARPDTPDEKTRNKDTLSDASLSLWLADVLPEILERSKNLLEDYFEELLECVCDIEAARSQLFLTLGISVTPEHRDLEWVKTIKLPVSNLPLFAWRLPMRWLLHFPIPWLRRFILREYERTLSLRVDIYCERLRSIAQQAARDWLFEIQRPLEQNLLNRTEGQTLSKDIRELMLVQWGHPS